MKYVVYLRVSTDRQDIDAQRSQCRKYIERMGGGNSHEFIDIDVSGSLRMEDREQMMLAIDSLEKGDIFLVDVRDRLGRNVYLNIVTSRKIHEKGATIACASQDMSHLDPGMMKLMETVLDAFSEFELYQIGMRTSKKLKEIKNQGFRTGHIPYGYQLGEAVERMVMTNKGLQKKVSHRITNEPYEQEILKKMEDLSSGGLDLRSIEQTLRKDGITGRSGKPFSHVSIHKILKNAQGHRMAYSVSRQPHQ